MAKSGSVKSQKRRRRGDRDGYPTYSDVSAWERHGQSIAATVAMFILGWVGYTVNENSKNIPVLTSQVAGLQSEVVGLKKTVQDDLGERYKRRDAERDFAAVYKEIDRMRSNDDRFMNEQAARGPRLKSLETRMDNLSTKILELSTSSKK